MKKSKVIQLALITSALASCTQKQDTDSKVFVRGDSTAPYSRGTTHGGLPMWFYAFRPYGYYDNGAYHRAGYYNSGISRSSNIGSNSIKSAHSTSRGGFGARSSSSHSFGVSS